MRKDSLGSEAIALKVRIFLRGKEASMTSHAQSDDPRQWLGYIPKTLHRSALYSHLYTKLKDDQEVIPLLSYVDKDQPILILFFSVINFLVLRERDHQFAQFYPYLSTSPRPASEAYPYFRDFCLTHRDEIQSLLSGGTRLQTNEVTRCANLLPAFELVSQRSGHQPLAFIEVGASAGLNLNWYKFGYQYGSISIGERHSLVQVQCTLEGNYPPPLPKTLPSVAQCVGIELFPLDIHKETDVQWLRACIWPEELERYQFLDAAIAMARHYPPPLLIGDACDLLPDLLSSIPVDQTICLWHSFALNQGPSQIKKCIEQTIVHASSARIIYRVSLEVNPTQEGRPRLELFTYTHGALSQHEWLADCTLHGERMQWRLPII